MSPTWTLHHESTFLAVFPIPDASHPADIMHAHTLVPLCVWVSLNTVLETLLCYGVFGGGLVYHKVTYCGHYHFLSIGLFKQGVPCPLSAVGHAASICCPCVCLSMNHCDCLWPYTVGALVTPFPGGAWHLNCLPLATVPSLKMPWSWALSSVMGSEWGQPCSVCQRVGREWAEHSSRLEEQQIPAWHSAVDTNTTGHEHIRWRGTKGGARGR